MRQPETLGLEQLQGSFLEDLTGRCPRGEAGRALVFAPPPRGDLEQRWHVYTSGYLARLVEALENDYPALRRILGERPFRSLTARYLQRFPPRSFDIGKAGARLPEFLDADPLRAELPFVGDLARFEWSLSEAFVAADAETLAWTDLAGLGAEAVADAVLRLLPGTALIRSEWPLLDLHGTQDVADAEVSIELDRRPMAMLVYRKGLEVRRRLLDDEDAHFLENAMHGIRLSDLADGAGETVPDLIDRFQLWVEEGLFEKPGALRQAAPRIEEDR